MQGQARPYTDSIPPMLLSRELQGATVDRLNSTETRIYVNGILMRVSAGMVVNSDTLIALAWSINLKDIEGPSVKWQGTVAHVLFRWELQ